MTKQRGFFGALFGIILMVAFVAGALYVLSVQTFPPQGPIPAQQPVATSSEPQTLAPLDPNATTTRSVTIESRFEGTWHFIFTFDYVPNQFKVEDIENKGVTIQPQTGTSTATSTITISYEGGRGFAPKDYWKEIGSKECAGCTATKAVITLPNASTTLTYENTKKIIQISTNPFNNNWLVIFTINKPVSAIKSILDTFKVISADRG